MNWSAEQDAQSSFWVWGFFLVFFVFFSSSTIRERREVSGCSTDEDERGSPHTDPFKGL